MATASLNNTGNGMYTGKDSVVVSNNQRSIRGGRTLDVTDFNPTVDPTVIKEGHVIIMETATKEYKPMPVVGNAYDVLPDGHVYAGILVATILKAKPFAGISYECDVNRIASPYPTAPIEAAIKTVHPNIVFVQD